MSVIRSARVWATAVATIALLVPAGAARADGTCVRTDGTLDVHIEGDSALSTFVLSRDPGGQILLEENLLLGSDDIDCGDASTANVDRILITGSPFVEELFIDLENGGFVPNPAPDPNSEIEIRIELGRGQDFAIVRGTAGPDTLRLGRRGVNWNEDDDGNDITFGSSIEFPGLFGDNGNDRLTGDGGSGTGGASRSPLFLVGGLGDDRIVGGAAGDWITGQVDDDELVGKGGSDRLGDNPMPGSFGNSSEDGVDLLLGGKGEDALRAGGGRDTLLGGGGDDEEHGGDGPDVFMQAGRRPNGADRFFGGSGSDTVRYSQRTGAVTVKLDGEANDGASGERDSVGYRKDVENIIGGKGGDRLVGDGSRNLLKGLRGPDRLNGRAATDACFGGPGQDQLTNCEPII